MNVSDLAKEDLRKNKMYLLQRYNKNEVGIILNERTGQVLFDASNVCAILGYAGSASDVLRKLDADEKELLSREDFDSTESVESKGGPQYKNFVTEPGLYKLIFGSQKPEAKEFTRWVTHEVLPAIRRTGQYATSAGQLDMAAIEKTFRQTKRLAKAAGTGAIEARRQAGLAVKEAYGVDVWKMLSLPEPVCLPRETEEKKARLEKKALEKGNRALSRQQRELIDQEKISTMRAETRKNERLLNMKARIINAARTGKKWSESYGKLNIHRYPKRTRIALKQFFKKTRYGVLWEDAC